MKIYSLLITLLFAAGLTDAKGVVVTTGVSGGGSGDFARFEVYQTPDNSRNTCFHIFTWDLIHFNFGICLDISLELFPVALGDRFTKELVLATPLGGLLGVGDVAFVPSSSFYLGIYTIAHISAFENFEPNLPRGIGWVKISYLDGTFAVEESAIDFSGQGLIVGTTTVIPEGSTLGCVLLVLLGLSTHRRRTG
jgi:hypothetical protein